MKTTLLILIQKTANLITVLMFFFCMLKMSSGIAQENNYQAFSYTKKEAVLPYRLLLPENYSPDKKYPLLLFLHGAGERGTDNLSQLIHGSSLFLNSSFRKKYPAIVVFPQCPKNSYWSSVDRNGQNDFSFLKKPKKNTPLALVEGLLKQLRSSYAVDKNKIYVGGLSMGGMGTFELVFRNPKMFAAAFAICGGAHPKTARRVRRPAWRIDHGQDDPVVPIIHSDRMVKALQEENASVLYFSYPNVNHDSWNNVFSDSSFLPWLFEQKK